MNKIIKFKFPITKRTPVRLHNIQVNEISGVDFPATRKKFLIVKNEKREPTAEVKMEIKPLRTDEEIEKYVRENWGSYSEYYARRFDPPPLVQEPEPVQKSAAEACADYFEAAAQAMGLSLVEFCERFPERYADYVRLAEVKI